MRAGRAISDYEVQQFITSAFREEKLVWADEPIVGMPNSPPTTFPCAGGV